MKPGFKLKVVTPEGEEFHSVARPIPDGETLGKAVGTVESEIRSGGTLSIKVNDKPEEQEYVLFGRETVNFSRIHFYHIDMAGPNE